MPRNRKKKNQNQKKKQNNNNNNNNNKNNKNTLKSHEKNNDENTETTNDPVAVTGTININTTSSNIAASTSTSTTIEINEASGSSATNENICSIDDGNSPIISNITKNNEISKENILCTNSIENDEGAAVNKNDLNNDQNNDNDNQNQQYVNDDASSSSASTTTAFLNSTSTPQYQSAIQSETNEIDVSILNNNLNKKIDHTDIKNLENDNIVIENNSVNNNIDENNIVNTVDVIDTVSTATIVEKSELDNLRDNSDNKDNIKTGGTTSKNGEIPNDTGTGTVKLIRKEIVNREMEIFKDMTITDTSSERNDTNDTKDTAVKIISRPDKQMSIQVKSVTYITTPQSSDIIDHVETDESQFKTTQPQDIDHVTIDELQTYGTAIDQIQTDQPQNIIDENVDMTNNVNVIEKNDEQINFIETLHKVYDNVNDETENLKQTLVEKSLIDKQDNIENVDQPELDETFSQIIAEFDKLDEDIDSAFLELSKDFEKGPLTQKITQEVVVTTKTTLKLDSLSRNSDIIESEMKKLKDSKRSEKVENVLEEKIKDAQANIEENIDALANKNIEISSDEYKTSDIPTKQELKSEIEIPISLDENIEILDENVEKTFSEIAATCDKFEQDIELVFNEITKPESEEKKPMESQHTNTVITQIDQDTSSEISSICTEEPYMTITSPKSVNSSDENIKDKVAKHFVTFEDITEDIIKEKLEEKISTPIEKIEKTSSVQIDNTVTVEDLGEDNDDDIIVLKDSEIESKDLKHDDFKSKKIAKRQALEKHFLPQFIEPRYLDCIKEENSDLSDAERKEDTESQSRVGSSGGTLDMFDDLEDDVFYDNEIYQKTNAVYPKIQLDFSKKKIKSSQKHPEPICEEDVQTIVETKIIEQQSIDEGCSKTWHKNLTPTSEQAEIIYLTSASSSSSGIDSDSDIKDQKHDLDETETRIKTPTIDYNQNFTNRLTTESVPDVISKENKHDENSKEKENSEKQNENENKFSPTCEENNNKENTNVDNDITIIGENSENKILELNKNEKEFTHQKSANEFYINTSTPVTSTSIGSGINNNIKISENFKTHLVFNEKLKTKEEENLAENFITNQPSHIKSQVLTSIITTTSSDENKENLNNLCNLTSTTTTTKITETSLNDIETTVTTTTEKTTTELSEKNLNIHNNEINLNNKNLEENKLKSAGNTEISSTAATSTTSIPYSTAIETPPTTVAAPVNIAGTEKGVLRQESTESYCSAHSHSTVSSQCTAIRKGSPTTAEENQPSSPTKSLKQICLESLTSMPYGKDVLEELASVSQALDDLTDKTKISQIQALQAEKIIEHLDMPYPLPEPPKIHNIELHFEPSRQQQHLENGKSETDSVPPLPPLPKLNDEIHKMNGSNLPNYKSYINELTNISTNKKVSESADAFKKDFNMENLENILQHSPKTTANSNLSSQFVKTFHETKYNITPSSQFKTETKTITSGPPPPVPPLPTLNKNISDSSNDNNHRLLDIIRNTSEPQKVSSSTETKTEKSSTGTNTEIKSETKSSSVFRDHHTSDMFDTKQFDLNSPTKRHLDNDNLWKFLNDPNYFKASVEKFPTSDIDSFFAKKSTGKEPPAIPKRYSNIETSSYESKKVYENGKLVSEIENRSHNDRVDENSLASFRKFMSESNLDDNWSSMKNDLKTFKNTADVTDSINKNVAIDQPNTEATKKQQTQQETAKEIKTESRKSDDFSYDEFRQRAKERAESKTKSEIFNTDDIFKEFKRFSENLDRDYASLKNFKSNLTSSSTSTAPSAQQAQQAPNDVEKSKIPTAEPKTEQKVFEEKSSKTTTTSTTQTGAKETTIPIKIENEVTTEQKTTTEKVVKEEIHETKSPFLEQLMKEFNIPIDFGDTKKVEDPIKKPPSPPPKTEHKIPISFDFSPQSTAKTEEKGQTTTKDTQFWTGTTKEHHQSHPDISRSHKEINIPIRMESKHEERKTESSMTQTNTRFEPKPESGPQIHKEHVVPIKIENNKGTEASPREIKIPIHVDNSNQQYYNKRYQETQTRQTDGFRSETDDDLPRSAPSTGYSGFDFRFKHEPPRAPLHSDEKRRRTYSSSAHEDYYRSDNTSDYWRSTENISSRTNTPSAWRSSIDLSSRVSTPSIDKIVKPIEKEVEICLFGKSPRIKAPRLTASTSNLYYMPLTPDYYHVPPPEPYTYTPGRSVSRRKYYTSCHSMIEESPSYSQNEEQYSYRHSRSSLPREINPQAEYIRKKEEELKKEYIALEDERQKLLKDLAQFNESLEKEIYETQLQKNAESRKHLMEQINNFQMNQRPSYQPRRRSWNLPSLTEEEALQQKMRDEWLNKIAERDQRLAHKVIKLTKPNDELGSSAANYHNARKFSDSINIGDEFLRRVKERRTKLNMPSDSDWESGAESQPVPSKYKLDQDHENFENNSNLNIKILENRSEADLKNLPKHLFEFAEFVKKFEEEHKDLEIFEKEKKTTNSITNLAKNISNLSNGVWSPNNNEPYNTSSVSNIQQHLQQQQQQHQQNQHIQQQQQPLQQHNRLTTTPTPPPPPPPPSLPIWSPQPSPQQPRKFRPVKFESPTLSRKYVREGSTRVDPPWVTDTKSFNQNSRLQHQNYQPLPLSVRNSGASGYLSGGQSLSCSNLNNIENNYNKFNYLDNQYNNRGGFGSTSSLKGARRFPFQRKHDRNSLFLF